MSVVSRRPKAIAAKASSITSGSWSNAGKCPLFIQNRTHGDLGPRCSGAIQWDISTVKTAFSAGPVAAGIVRRFVKATGLTADRRLRLTEATLPCGSSNPTDGLRKVGSIGITFPYNGCEESSKKHRRGACSRLTWTRCENLHLEPAVSLRAILIRSGQKHRLYYQVKITCARESGP